MAIMYPNEFKTKTFSDKVEESGYKFEKKMYEFLKESNNTDDIIVRYSLSQRNSTIKSKDSEIDFLVISKNHGLVIIEAKGGEGYYKYDNGFFKKGNEIFSPFEQAKKQKEKLINYIKDCNEKVEDSKKINISYSSIKYCIAFEKFKGNHFDGTIDELDKNCIIYYEEVCSNKNFFADFLNKLNTKNKLSDEYIANLLECIKPKFTSVNDEISIIDEHNKRAKMELEKHYDKLVDELDNEYSNALVVGSAGCGKTYIAKELVKRKRNKGLNVAYFAYNIFFTEEVEKELGEGCDFNNICKPLKEFFKEYSLATMVLSEDKLKKFLDNSRDEFYKKYIYDYIFAALEKNPLQYDAIVLDEAEDIANADNLLVLSLMLKGGLDKGKIYIFADFNQAVYDKSLISIEEFYTYLKSMNKKFGKPIELDINFRNPYKITYEVNKILNLDIKSYNSEDYGDYDTKQYKGYTSRINNLDDILEEYINNESFKNNLDRITILSNYNCRDSELIDKSPLKDSKFKEYFVSYNNREKNKISVTMLRKFKGLTNDIIIMVDLNNYIPYGEKEPKKDLLYIGITSANYKVHLLESDEEKKIHIRFK